MVKNLTMDRITPSATRSQQRASFAFQVDQVQVRPQDQFGDPFVSAWNGANVGSRQAPDFDAWQKTKITLTGGPGPVSFTFHLMTNRAGRGADSGFAPIV